MFLDSDTKPTAYLERMALPDKDDPWYDPDWDYGAEREWILQPAADIYQDGEFAFLEGNMGTDLAAAKLEVLHMIQVWAK